MAQQSLVGGVSLRAAAILAALAAPLAPAGPAPAGRERPNIVFILADDLGYGDLGCYGQQRIRTPNLDRLAAEGMRFTQFYAGSTVCAPSRCALMTGLHTGHCFIRGNARESLRPQDVTAAAVLKRAGYATGLIGKWGLGHEGTPGVPGRQGFDEFFGYLDQVHAHNYYPQFLLRNEGRVPLKNVVPEAGDAGQGVATVKVEYSHDLLAAEALSFIDRHRDHPFFLYLAWTIPHANNEAKEQGMEVPDLGIYKDEDWPEPLKAHAAMVSRMDADVGRLMARLEERGLDEDTIVFFSSDNGPHREGGFNPGLSGSSGPLRGIKRDLYEGGIRVPMLARWPGRIPAGATSDHAGAFWDVLPTLAELTGTQAPSNLDGISFVPALLGKGGQQSRHPYLYWAFFERGGARAVRTGRWKAVEQPMHTPVQLYDLGEDPGEARNLAADYAEIAARMKDLMDRVETPSQRWRFPERDPARGSER